jgi:hypothetical protein
MEDAAYFGRPGRAGAPGKKPAPGRFSANGTAWLQMFSFLFFSFRKQFDRL